MNIPSADSVPMPGATNPSTAELHTAPRSARPHAVVHAAPPAALSTTPNLFGLLLALRRRWLLALTLGLLVGPSVAAVVWVLRPVTFAARTILEIKARTEVVLYALPERGGDLGSHQRGQIALVKSRLVLNSALRDPQVENLPLVRKQQDPVAWLEREIQADFAIAPEIMRIAMTGEDTHALPKIVDAVRRAYLSEVVQKDISARQKRLDNLRRYSIEYESRLRDKRESLKRMARNVGLPNKDALSMKQELNDQYLHELQRELLKRQSDRMTAQMELSGMTVLEKTASDAPVAAATIEAQFKKDAVVQRFQHDIVEAEVELAAFRERSPNPEKEPGFQQALRRIATAKTEIAKRREKLMPTIVQEARDTIRDDQEARRLQLKRKVDFLMHMEKRMEEEIEARTKEGKVFKEDVVDLAWLQDEIAQLDTVQKDATRQINALEVEIQAPPRFNELEEAIVVPAQTESNRMRMAGGSGIGAFLAVILGIALLEFRSRRINSAEEVVQGLKMKLVGSLPLVPRRALTGRPAARKHNHWHNRLTESVDAVRTTLLSAARYDAMRRIMVTSAVGGEGKTLLSCHLAVSLARAGYKTLLIDGDLRRPSVHKLFNVALGRGLSELLRGEAVPASVVTPGPIDGLNLVTAGQADHRAIQQFARTKIGDTLTELSAGYDFVVVDSAPVLPVADAQLLAQHVDGVVFSVMRDVSRLPVVYAACERLALLHVRVVGAVVNGIQGGTYQDSAYVHTIPAVAAVPGAAK